MASPDVPLFDVRFTAEDREAALAPLDDGWLTMGPRIERFEQAFARALGVPHVIAVSSGTAALHLALLALDIGAGDEVICPSLTFVATANAIRYVGATPVFCEVTSSDDPSIDPDHVASLVTDRTRAVIAVHLAGYPADLEKLAALCERHGIELVEDSAHACITTLGDRACGAWGACGCFSFYSNKNITCGEGGAIATADARRAARLRGLRSHAMSTTTVERHDGRAFAYDVTETGYNYRMDEIRAALLMTQLGRLGEFEAGRREAVERYAPLLSGLAIETPTFGGRARGAARFVQHIYPVLLAPGSDRARVMRRMRELGVQTSVHYPPVHRLGAFDPSGDAPALPLTEALAARELTLPLFPALSEAQQVRVRDALATALAEERADRVP